MVQRNWILKQQNAEMPEEFGFNYPHNIHDTWGMVTVLELFNAWPEQGGYLDQDALLVDDIIMLKNIKNHIEDRNRPKGDGTNGR